jgi:serine/threonine-protein kinase
MVQGPASLVGRIVDARYRIDGKLGEGGIGVVYRAEHLALGRAVAIKVLLDELAAMPDQRARFVREAKALSALSHPHVVPINDFGIADGMPYLVMELLEGRTLEQLLAAEGPLEPARALDIFRQMLRGLAFAHSRGIAHRDLKPGNVFLQSLPDHADHVRLLDFGLAKFFDVEGSRTDETLTKAGIVFGTPAYMAPEQATGEAADARADVYGAGVMLFELLTNRRPFQAASRADLLRAHLVTSPPRPEALRPGLALAPELSALLDRALAKDPGARFPDAGALLAALDAVPAPPVWLDPVAAGQRAAAARGGPAGQPAGAPASDAPGSDELRGGDGEVRTVASGRGRAATPPGQGERPAARAEPTARLRSKGRSPLAGVAGVFGALVALAAVAAGAALVFGSGGFAGGEADTAPVSAGAPGPGAFPPSGEPSRPGDPGRDRARAGSGGATPARGAGGPDAADPGARDADPGQAGSRAGSDAALEVRRPPAVRERARDPFRGGRLPAPLVRARRAIDARRFDRRDYVELQRYVAANRDDVRGHLVLAAGMLAMGWREDALARFRLAYQIDPSARGHAESFRLLCELAGSERHRSRVVALLASVWGDEAGARFDAEVRRAADPSLRGKLTALRAEVLAAVEAAPTSP